MVDSQLTFPTRSMPAPLEAVRVPSMSDVELDALPFGVICLDREGVVLRYNFAEARLARLDRSLVVGKNFYNKIAPCTATPEFQGRVSAFLDGTKPFERFPYLFDFKFGAQRVEIELVRVAANDRVYLLVNRQKVEEPREGLPAGFAAPLQEELAPGEEDQGVRRDDLSRRILSVDLSFVTALHQTWLKVAPKAWPGFTREWGWQWGRHAVVELEASLLEEKMTTLRELKMREAMERVALWASDRGLGLLRFDFSHAREGLFSVKVERSAVGEAVGQVDTPSCHLIEGLLEAVCEHLSQRLLAVRELRCCAQGFEACTFIVAAEKRKAAVERAIAAGAEDVPAIVEALRAAR